MNLDSLLSPVFGDAASLRSFALENAMEHKLFARTLQDSYGVSIAQYPIMDIDASNFDDWLQVHALTHMAEANAVQTTIPPWLNDVNMDQQDAFYEWIGNHAALHQFFADLLGV